MLTRGNKARQAPVVCIVVHIKEVTMSRSVLSLALVAGLLASPLAPYAVTTAAAAETASVATGASIYDAVGQKVGTVTDVLTSSKGTAFAVVDVGGYVGKPKVVLCPVASIGGNTGHMTVQMTRADVERLPDFGYNVSAGGG
jgi:hypothetical protein